MDVREVLREGLLSNRVITESGCWEWTKSRQPKGYGQITYPGLGRSVLAHRAAAMVWMNFDIFSTLCVCHHCDNPPCFNPAHLFIGTIADNQRDMARKGRARGGMRPDALKPEQILHIRSLVAAGYTRRSVARRVGVSHTTIIRHCKGLPFVHWTKAVRF